MGTFLIQDPHHEYAVALIRLIRERYGHRPIAFFTQRKDRFYRRAELEGLDRADFAASYDVPADRLFAFGDFVRRHHRDLVGVVPYSEETLDAARVLLPVLGIEWNPPKVLARFRQKHAMKAHLRSVAPDLRLNFCARVRRIEDILALGRTLPTRVILKPADGFGSKGVGVFDGRDARGMAAFLATRTGETFVLEEFLDGTLHTVDGFVDADGEVRIAAIFTSGRTRANGSDVVYTDGALVHRDEPAFDPLAEYATRVMRASGLRRSPFHMEVMLDDRGPCLVEVGARLVGHSHARTLSDVHGGRLDVFGATAHAVLSARPLGDPGLDWNAYESTDARKVYGIATAGGVIYRLDGVAEVERLRAFSRWIVRPQVGQGLKPTVDLFTVPWSLVLRAPRGEIDLDRTVDAVRERLRWNTVVDPLDRAQVELGVLRDRVRKKLEWWSHRARTSFAPDVDRWPAAG